MNTIVTSREEILKASRELIRQEGWSAISIRSVAAACGVSVGSIYNYFDSKTELVGATVESVWEEIFHRPENADMFQNIVSCITWMFERMAYGSRQYPGFFTLHSLSFMQKEKSEGKLRMQYVQPCQNSRRCWNFKMCRWLIKSSPCCAISPYRLRPEISLPLSDTTARGKPPFPVRSAVCTRKRPAHICGMEIRRSRRSA